MRELDSLCVYVSVCVCVCERERERERESERVFIAHICWWWFSISFLCSCWFNCVLAVHDCFSFEEPHFHLQAFVTVQFVWPF